MSKKKNQLVRHSSGGLVPSRLSKALSQELARIDAAAEVSRHKSQRHMELTIEATARGMVGAGYLSALELSLVQATPHGQNRITAITNAGCYSLQRFVEAEH